MAKFACNAQSLLQTAHRDIALLTRGMSTKAASLEPFGQQLEVYQGIFNDIADTGKEFININQREINREIAPTIMKAMIVAYDACEAEIGIELITIQLVDNRLTIHCRPWQLCSYEEHSNHACRYGKAQYV